MMPGLNFFARFWMKRKKNGCGYCRDDCHFHCHDRCHVLLIPLRHDYRDGLREGEVDRALADYVMGHASEGVGAIYGGRPSLARLKAAIEAVAYPVALPS